MGEQSAGLLAYRRTAGGLEVLLVHPGGPFWRSKDAGVWSIPKGLIEAGEDGLSAARTEFAEETGVHLAGRFIPLGALNQPSGKTVHAWAVEGDLDPAGLTSNTFEIEWPPKSGRRQQFPEIDRGGWFAMDVAHEKILKGQAGFLDRLADALGTEA